MVTIRFNKENICDRLSELTLFTRFNSLPNALHLAIVDYYFALNNSFYKYSCRKPIN